MERGEGIGKRGDRYASVQGEDNVAWMSNELDRK